MNRKRIFFFATVASHIKAFHLPFINLPKEKGYEVEGACHLNRPLNDLKYVWEILFSRSPYSIDNLRVLKSLQGLIQERNYGLIHVHTPLRPF